MNETCENYVKCPIYSGILKSNEMASDAYKKQYCDAGSEGWNKCKRYIIKQKTGTCPPNVLPNSSRTVEELIVIHGLQVV